jgi:hypothetical protein
MGFGAENNKPPQTKGVGWCELILDGCHFAYFLMGKSRAGVGGRDVGAD